MAANATPNSTAAVPSFKEAFGLYQKPQPPFHTGLFECRDHRNGIGCGQKHPQQERRLPGPLDEKVHPGNGHACREQHAQRRQNQDGEHILAEFLPGDLQGRFKDERREKGREDQRFGQTDV